MLYNPFNFQNNDNWDTDGLYWYNEFYTKKPVWTGLNQFHGLQKTGPRWSGSVPTISGSVLDWLRSMVARFGGKKPDWTRLANTSKITWSLKGQVSGNTKILRLHRGIFYSWHLLLDTKWDCHLVLYLGAEHCTSVPPSFLSRHCQYSAPLSADCLQSHSGTVRPLITHTFQWKVQVMGFQGLWVYMGWEKSKCSWQSQNFWENLIFFITIGLLDWKANNQCHLGKSLLMCLSSEVLASWLNKDWAGEEGHCRLISEYLVINGPITLRLW